MNRCGLRLELHLSFVCFVYMTEFKSCLMKLRSSFDISHEAKRFSEHTSESHVPPLLFVLAWLLSCNVIGWIKSESAERQ